MKLILIFLLFSQTTGLRVIHLQGPDALTAHQLQEALAIASTKLALANKPIKVMKIIRHADPCIASNTLSRFPSQFSCFEAIAKRRKRFKHGPTLVVSGPISHTDGQRYLGGAANLDCVRHVSRRVSWFAATGSSIGGESRIYMSGIGIAHELGHNFGASHLEGTNIMSTDALGLARTNTPLFFTPVSETSFLQCRNRGFF